MPARWPDTRFVLPPLLSAVLLVLAQPPFHVLPLAFLALAPMAAGVALLPPGSGGGSGASLQGLIFGLLFWGFSLMWVPLEVGRHFSWALPGYGVLLILLGGLSALFAWILHRLHHGGGMPLALAVPLAWVGVEWIRAHFPMGLAFPWLGLGVTLTPWPWLLGMAEWAGESGVVFWLACVSGWVAREMVRVGGRGRGRWEGLRVEESGRRTCSEDAGWGPGPLWGSGRFPVFRVLMVAVLLVPPLLGWMRAGTLPLQPGPKVVVIGTHVARELRSDPMASAREAMAQIRTTLESSWVSPSAELILLPEATVPLPLEGDEAAFLREELGLMAARFGSPLVVGGLGQVPDGDGAHPPTNSAYLVSPTGEIPQRYDKVRLVPGMEAGRYRSGGGGKTLEYGRWVFGPLVCYESLFGALARKARRQGAHALLNLTSDIWFGEGDTGLGALFLHQHPAHLVLRAVENRMPVARAANGGFSLILDPLGRVSSQVVPPEGGLVGAQLLTTPGMTVFTRVGDLVGPASVLLTLLFLVWGRRNNTQR